LFTEKKMGVFSDPLEGGYLIRKRRRKKNFETMDDSAKRKSWKTAAEGKYACGGKGEKESVPKSMKTGDEGGV